MHASCQTEFCWVSYFTFMNSFESQNQSKIFTVRLTRIENLHLHIVIGTGKWLFDRHFAAINYFFFSLQLYNITVIWWSILIYAHFSGRSLETGRTFGQKRIQFMIMPLIYKMGVIVTMLIFLTVISLKGLAIGEYRKFRSLI